MVDLENDNRFGCFGSSRQRLHGEAPKGLQRKGLFREQGNKGVFTWNGGHSIASVSDGAGATLGRWGSQWLTCNV